MVRRSSGEFGERNRLFQQGKAARSFAVRPHVAGGLQQSRPFGLPCPIAQARGFSERQVRQTAGGAPGLSPIARISSAALSAALALLLFAFATASPASGAPDHSGENDPRGIWVDHKQKVAVRIEICEDSLCGRIVWLKNPRERDGRLKRDGLNPDAAMRNRPLCGLGILRGFRLVTAGTWADGEIYNPNDGHIYGSTLIVENGDILKIRGYFGISLIGKTTKWTRMPDPKENCGPFSPSRNAKSDAGG